MSNEPTNESDFEAAQLIESPQMLESIERAQIDMQIATAHKYKRTLSKVKADMLSFATLDEDTAAGCFYTLPRGGKTIQGPSIRLAEIAVSCYGNLRAGSRCVNVNTGKENPHVVIQSVCHDLEKNVAITIEKRRRITKKKNKDAIDEDDINLAVNAGAAIALRDAIFKVIPLALVKPVYEQAKLVAIGKATSLADKRGKVIDRLKQMGATMPNILAVVEARTIEDVDADKLGILIGLGTALKDGETTIEEAFPAAQIGKGETLASVLGEKPRADADPAKSDGKAASGDSGAATSEQQAAETEPTGAAYTEAEFKTAVTLLENYALNLSLTEPKLIEQAKKLNQSVPKDAKKLAQLPYQTLTKLTEWAKAFAAGNA